ncbi:hypothetical protein J3R30DRAFT_3553267 [Lentinula aciculospora]|uniref:Uncharacterized protein n=1 Tax=Lentinula aciculospora TaxID=153920 RepID=A0A9W8ZXZ3_9AGAR|nr:hypothetical protein J3R30DRAFT_3553267 [Lentinula aciculospora]
MYFTPSQNHSIQHLKSAVVEFLGGEGANPTSCVMILDTSEDINCALILLTIYPSLILQTLAWVVADSATLQNLKGPFIIIAPSPMHPNSSSPSANLNPVDELTSYNQQFSTLALDEAEKRHQKGMDAVYMKLGEVYMKLGLLKEEQQHISSWIATHDTNYADAIRVRHLINVIQGRCARELGLKVPLHTDESWAWRQWVKTNKVLTVADARRLFYRKLFTGPSKNHCLRYGSQNSLRDRHEILHTRWPGHPSGSS